MVHGGTAYLNGARRAQEATVEAMGRVEAGLLRDIEEQIGSCLSWPSHMTAMLLSTHLRFNDRYQLSLFMLGNGCPPTSMVKWFLSRGMLSDKSARENVADLIRRHMDGTLERAGTTTWVMNATEVPKPVWERKHPWDGVGEPAVNKTRIVATPTFALDWQHQHHWTDAINALKTSDGRPDFVATQPWKPSLFQKRPRENKVEMFNRWEAEKRSS